MFAISKLIAGRQKDVDFVKHLIRYGLLSVGDMESAASELPQHYAALVSGFLRAQGFRG